MGPEDRHQISPLPALVRGWTQQVLAERGDRYLEAQSSRQGGSGRPTGFLLNPGLLKSWSSFLLLPLPPPAPTRSVLGELSPDSLETAPIPQLHGTALLRLRLPPGGVVLKLFLVQEEGEKHQEGCFRYRSPWVHLISNTLCSDLYRGPPSTQVLIRLSAPFRWLMCPYGESGSLSPLLCPQG